MNNYLALINKELKKYDIITSSFCKDNDIPLVYLTRLADKKKIFKLAHGIYTNQEIFLDNLWLKQQINKKVIYSYLTALNLLEATSWIGEATFCEGPIGYKVNKKYQLDLTIDSKYYGLGKITVKSPEGRDITCYCYERVLCDLVRKGLADGDWTYEAFANYNKYHNKDLKKLKQIASTMQIDLNEFTKRGLVIND